jgi:hypothetical protein
MSEALESGEVRVGDLIEVHGHAVGERARLGEILEVLGSSDHLHFRVRWDNDRESIFYPSNDAVVRPARHHDIPATPDPS